MAPVGGTIDGFPMSRGTAAICRAMPMLRDILLLSPSVSLAQSCYIDLCCRFFYIL